MNNPRHEQVRLRPTERAEFTAIARRFGPQPCDPPERPVLGWRNRARALFFSHLAACALLVPIGVAAMGAAVLVWWPLGLIGAGLVAIGLAATIELARARRFGRRVQSISTKRKT